MIDIDILRSLINQKESFRIGTRGICCECRFIPIRNCWTLLIGRAFVEVIADELEICDDVDFCTLDYSVDGGRTFRTFLDLSKYDKVTPL